MELFGLDANLTQYIVDTYPDVVITNRYEELTNTKDLLIVTETALTQAELIAYRESTDRPIICLANGDKPHYQSIAAAHGINFVHPDNLQILLERQFKRVKSKPILAFWGTTPQVGTTSLALSLASQLVYQHDLSVAVLGLNLYDPGSWAVNHPSVHLDDLMPFLSARNLTPERLRENMHTLYSGAHYLLGNKHPLLPLKFNDKEIDFLIDLASDMYDILVLDLGAYLNTAAALQGLARATHRYVVTPNRIYNGERFSQAVQTVIRPLGIETEEIMLIGNRMSQPRQLTGYAKSMKVTPITAIPEINLMIAPGTDIIKTFMDQTKWKKAMQTIASGIVHTEGAASAK